MRAKQHGAIRRKINTFPMKSKNNLMRLIALFKLVKASTLIFIGLFNLKSIQSGQSVPASQERRCTLSWS